jgi:hypothetical protein
MLQQARMPPPPMLLPLLLLLCCTGACWFLLLFLLHLLRLLFCFVCFFLFMFVSSLSSAPSAAAAASSCSASAIASTSSHPSSSICLQIAQQRGLVVEQRPVDFQKEVGNFKEIGAPSAGGPMYDTAAFCGGIRRRGYCVVGRVTLIGFAGMCGTAAVVVKVASITRGSKTYEFPTFDTMAGLRGELTAIQHGVTSSSSFRFHFVC